MKYKIVLLIIIAITMMLCANWSKINVIYIRIFKISTLISKYNSRGQSEGESTLYKNGAIDRQATFINGKKVGWAFTYHKNGKVLSKSFYQNDIENGPDSQFYENGKLNYSGYLRNGLPYGNVKWYLMNGQLDSYAVFNIKGKSFCLFQYDIWGVLVKMTGWVVSPVIYSLDKNKSFVIIESGKKYNNIKDLYITVATPPNMKQQALIYINRKSFPSPIIKNNTIRIPYDFKNKGLYNIIIKYALTDRFDHKMGSINLKEEIVVE